MALRFRKPTLYPLIYEAWCRAVSAIWGMFAPSVCRMLWL
jgi:hypothetical protein